MNSGSFKFIYMYVYVFLKYFGIMKAMFGIE